MAEVVLNIAFALYVGASWLRSELWLRVVLMASSTGSAIAGVLIGSPSMIVWNAVFVVAMGIRVARVFAHRRAIALSPEEAWIRAAVFPQMSRSDFVQLWEAGDDKVYDEEPLLVEGDTADELMLVLRGAPAVLRRGEVVANLWPGQFAGEMAFATRAPATATVSPDGEPVQCRVWSTTRLRGVFRTSPELAVAFEQAVSVDVISKFETAPPLPGRSACLRF